MTCSIIDTGSWWGSQPFLYLNFVSIFLLAAAMYNELDNCLVNWWSEKVSSTENSTSRTQLTIYSNFCDRHCIMPSVHCQHWESILILPIQFLVRQKEMDKLHQHQIFYRRGKVVPITAGIQCGAKFSRPINSPICGKSYTNR